MKSFTGKILKIHSQQAQQYDERLTSFDSVKFEIVHFFHFLFSVFFFQKYLAKEIASAVIIFEGIRKT